jgi:hypothetical protein
MTARKDTAEEADEAMSGDMIALNLDRPAVLYA